MSTPGALEQEITSSRSITLQTEGDPLSLIALTDARTVNGNTWTWDYDASTSEITMTTPEGRQVVTTLTAQATADTVAQGTLPLIDVDYDTAGRIDQITVGTGGTARVMAFSYDANGYLDELVDPANQTHGFQHDLVGRLEVFTRPDLEDSSYTYDDNGRLATVTLPSSDAHDFDYDTADRLTSYDPPAVAGVSAPATDLTYTDDHELNTVTRPDGQSITFAYGLTSARLDAITTPLGDYDLTYDSAGRVSQVDDPDGGSLAYGYDGFLLTSETSTGDVGGLLAWTYNDDFRVVTQTVNSTSTVSYTYDDDGLVLSAGASTLTRDGPNGRITDIDVVDATTLLGYDAFGALDTLTTTVDTTTMFDATYGPRDALDRLVEFDETVDGVSRTLEFTYDDAGRLETVTENSTLVATYGWDENGNRTSVTTASGTVSASYDAQDRLSSYGDLDYAYNENGDLETITDTNTSDVTSFDYDVFGNLRSVELPDATLIEYVIDARGRRVGKLVDAVFDRAWLYSGKRQIIAELDDQGAIVSRFVYGSSSAAPDYMVAGGTTYRLITDHLGSVRLVVDAGDGTIVQQLDYDPFGVVLVDTNPGFQPFGFAGGLYDPDTGLVRFGVRDYDPNVGRWTTKDPSLFAGGENLYGYCEGDPVNLVDRSGRDPQLPLPSAPTKPEPVGPSRPPAPKPSPKPSPGGGGGSSGGPLAACRASPHLCLFALGFCLGCPSCCGIDLAPGDNPFEDGPTCDLPDPPPNFTPDETDPSPGDPNRRKPGSRRCERDFNLPRHANCVYTCVDEQTGETSREEIPWEKGECPEVVWL